LLDAKDTLSRLIRHVSEDVVPSVWVVSSLYFAGGIVALAGIVITPVPVLREVEW